MNMFETITLWYCVYFRLRSLRK